MNKAYSGYIKDIDKLRKSASGGAATILSEQIIKNGGVVFGVQYAKDFKSAEYGCAETMKQLEKFKASKKSEKYAQFVSDLKEKGHTICEDEEVLSGQECQ